MKKSAFTLIELLVVIVIIGILATIGVAQFNSYQEKARLAKALAFASQVDRVLLAELTSQSLAPVFKFNFEEGSGDTYKNIGGLMPDCEHEEVDGLYVTDTPTGRGFAYQEAGGISCDNWSSYRGDNTTEFTFSMWLKQDVPAIDHANWVNLDSSTTSMHLQVDGAIGARINSDVIVSDPGVFENGIWQHFVLSYNGTVVKLWKDGDLVFNTPTAESSIDPLVGSFLLHNNTIPIQHGDFRAGLIDDFAYYPIALREF
jgi:prepilin-type N-terminal cleavage/methylation domain-containing protein